MKEKKVFKATIKYFALTVLGLIILFNCLSFVMSRTGNVPGRIIGRFYTVETGSMEPDIKEGDLLYVIRTPIASLSPGEAVTVIMDGKTVTHRLVRVSGGTVVTRGNENEDEDLPVSFENYLGRAAVVIPAGGIILEAFTSVPVLAASVAVFLILLFLKPVADLLMKKTERMKIGATRIAALIAAASAALVPTAATLARYSASFQVNKAVSAAEMNFSSNFLAITGNRYDIIGWNGAAYNIDFRISNYQNLLKYNEDGVDVKYVIMFEKITDDGVKTYTDHYGLTFTQLQKEEIVESDGIKQTRAIPWAGCDGGYTETVNPLTTNVIKTESGIYTLSGGIQYNDNIRLTVDANADGNMTLTDNEQIKFKVTARTISGIGYEQEISAVYTMTLTTAEHFIESRSFDQAEGTQVVKLNLKSATIIGIDSKKVVVEWDNDILFLNEYDANTMSLIASGNFILDKDNGKLTFSMSASSSTTFEFYKKSSLLGITLEHEFDSLTDEFGTEYEHIRIYEKPTGS